MKNKLRTYHTDKGFTLIEMLVTITIIVILAGLSLGGFKYVSAKQANSQAALQVNLLSKALEEYKLDNGDYPATGNSATNNTNLLYQEFYSKAAGGNKDAKIYLAELDPESNKQGWLSGSGNSRKITDPWGKEYYYRTAKNTSGNANSSAINPDFDLYSAGQDGLTSDNLTDSKTKDDIKNF